MQVNWRVGGLTIVALATVGVTTPPTLPRQKVWQANHVAFEISLPEGSYSWKLVAVFGRDGAGDFEGPAQCSFEIR
jgi:hypothetical protein